MVIKDREDTGNNLEWQDNRAASQDMAEQTQSLKAQANCGQGLQEVAGRKKESVGIKKKTKQKQKQELNVCSQHLKLHTIIKASQVGLPLPIARIVLFPFKAFLDAPFYRILPMQKF